MLYNTELGNGGRVGEDVQEGKIQESYKTGTGQARRAEGSRVIIVPCLIKAYDHLGRLGAGEVGGATMEAGKNANSTADPQQLLPKDVRAATTAPGTSQVLIKSLSNPSTKAPLSYFIGDKTVRVRSMAEASEW